MTEIYDNDELRNIDVGDRIIIRDDEGNTDQIEVTNLKDDGEYIYVSGYSHDKGDDVIYHRDAFTEVALWMV